MDEVLSSMKLWIYDGQSKIWIPLKGDLDWNRYQLLAQQRGGQGGGNDPVQILYWVDGEVICTVPPYTPPPERRLVQDLTLNIADDKAAVDDQCSPIYRPYSRTKGRNVSEEKRHHGSASSVENGNRYGSRHGGEGERSMMGYSGSLLGGGRSIMSSTVRGVGHEKGKSSAAANVSKQMAMATYLESRLIRSGG